jgi:transcriptional regulator with XRE-family HTH domain
MTHPLLAYRLRHRLTQAVFAARIGRIASTVSRWESGERTPGLVDVSAIIRATAGEVTADDLVTWSTRGNIPSRPARNDRDQTA